MHNRFGLPAVVAGARYAYVFAYSMLMRSCLWFLEACNARV